MDKSILLVDDVLMYTEIYKEFLQYTGVDVITARDGVEALAAMKAKKPDLIFMDLEMPRMDGAACCRIIKTDPGYMDIPVIMISSNDMDEDQNICFSVGCDYFLCKPVYRNFFLETARRFLPDIDRRKISGVSHRKEKTLMPIYL